MGPLQICSLCRDSMHPPCCLVGLYILLPFGPSPTHHQPPPPLFPSCALWTTTYCLSQTFLEVATLLLPDPTHHQTSTQPLLPHSMTHDSRFHILSTCRSLAPRLHQASTCASRSTSLSLLQNFRSSPGLCCGIITHSMGHPTRSATCTCWCTGIRRPQQATPLKPTTNPSSGEGGTFSLRCGQLSISAQVCPMMQCMFRVCPELEDLNSAGGLSL